MKKHCRVVVTDACNLRCDYCAMKDLEVSSSFIPITLKELLDKDHEIYCLTGGEPTMFPMKLSKVVQKIRNKKPNAEIYIYTNGLASLKLFEELANLKVNGINIGWHGMEMYEHIDAINQIIPCRVYALYYEVTDKLETYCRARDVELRKLSWKQCDNPDEDRYRLFPTE